MNANAEIILVRSDGALVLQVRDDKPGITNPGYISSFGGKIESGESPLDAAWREIQEETSLRPSKEEIKFYKKYVKTKKEYGEDWDVYYHVLNNVSDEGLEVYEGQGFVVVHGRDDMNQFKLTKLLAEVLEDYFDSYDTIGDEAP